MRGTFALLAVLLIGCVAVGGYAAYKIHTESSEVSAAEELSHEADGYAPRVELGYSELYSDFQPKLKALKAINEDVIGWIYIPQTNISYPLLQGTDNEYYLTHSVSRQYTVGGSIFVDKRGFSTNTVIYGHNMGRSSSIMFHDVTNFSDTAWFEKVKSGYIITEDGITELSIFAYSLTVPQSQLYYDEVTADSIKSVAVHYREPEQGNIVNLSTCAYDYDNARAVLSCTARMAWSPTA
jgi:sortase B